MGTSQDGRTYTVALIRIIILSFATPPKILWGLDDRNAGLPLRKANERAKQLMPIPPIIKILSVILGIVSCSLCRAASGPQPQLVEKELVLSVDPITNTASGLIHLSNPTEREISISLSADDFRA